MVDAMPDVLAIFGEALAQSTDEDRSNYLDKACGDDIKLRGRLDSLLRAHQDAGHFLGGSASATVAHNAGLTERPGAVIGRYKLLEQIGEGGFGVVFLAEQERPVRRRVALKVIKPGMDTRQVIARFEAERQALAIMDLPNIAKVFDAGATDSGRPYFVMELVRGEPITEFCDRHQVSPRERLELFAQVCHAVQHAHQKGIIHRDIKPTNVLVAMHDTTPVVKVIDFGVAKALGQELTDKTLFTGFGQFLGTPLYMSPEQAGHSALDIDTRSDIYSLGVLLYELLTGTTPFDKERFRKAAHDEICRIIREEEPPKPSTRLSESKESLPSISAQRHTEPAKLTNLVRGELDWIVMKALEKERARRYETASGMARDIERYLHDEPVEACPPTTSYRLRKFTRRHRVPLTVAAGFLLLLLAAAAVSTYQAIRIRAEQQNTLAQKLEADRQRNRAERERDRAVAAEHKALTEARKSEQVAAFMTDMIKGVGPSVSLGRDTTMLREILDRTSERIGRDLQAQPDVEAELRITLGQVYRDLGEFQKAEAMHRRALDLNRERFGNQHDAVADAMHSLSVVLRNQRNLQEAEFLEREALAIRMNLHSGNDSLVADSLDALGVILHQQWRNAEAEPLHREALAIRRKVFGDEHPAVADTLSNLAILVRIEGRLSESESMHREALAIRRKLFGNDHPEVASSVGGLANLLRDQGKLKEAEALHREALTIRRKIYGAHHPLVAQSLTQLAFGLLWQARLSEADKYLVEAVAMQMKLSGEQPASSSDNEKDRLKRDKAVAYREWAKEANRQDKFDVAETAARKAIELRPDDASAHRHLSIALRCKGRIDEAIVSSREAMRLAPNDAWSHYHLGNALLKKGKLDEAIAAYRQTLQLQPNHPYAKTVLANALSGKVPSSDDDSAQQE